MTDEIFDPLPGDDYPDGPVDQDGEPLDVGPPAPGEFDPKDYPNPELEMEC